MEKKEKNVKELIDFEKINYEEIQEVDEVVTAMAGTVHCCPNS